MLPCKAHKALKALRSRCCAEGARPEPGFLALHHFEVLEHSFQESLQLRPELQRPLPSQTLPFSSRYISQRCSPTCHIFPFPFRATRSCPFRKSPLLITWWASHGLAACSCHDPLRCCRYSSEAICCRLCRILLAWYLAPDRKPPLAASPYAGALAYPDDCRSAAGNWTGVIGIRRQYRTAIVLW
jgi:hypothetical protein